MRLLIAFAALALAALAPAGPARAEVPSVGQTASEALAVAGVEIPLPRGTWKVYFVRETAAPDYPRTDIGLVRVRARIVQQMIYATVAHACLLLGRDAAPATLPLAGLLASFPQTARYGRSARRRGRVRRPQETAGPR